MTHDAAITRERSLRLYDSALRVKFQYGAYWDPPESLTPKHIIPRSLINQLITGNCGSNDTSHIQPLRRNYFSAPSHYPLIPRPTIPGKPDPGTLYQISRMVYLLHYASTLCCLNSLEYCSHHIALYTVPQITQRRKEPNFLKGTCGNSQWNPQFPPARDFSDHTGKETSGPGQKLSPLRVLLSICYQFPFWAGKTTREKKIKCTTPSHKSAQGTSCRGPFLYWCALSQRLAFSKMSFLLLNAITGSALQIFMEAWNRGHIQVKRTLHIIRMILFKGRGVIACLFNNKLSGLIVLRGERSE